jgi:hypothetical protein
VACYLNDNSTCKLVLTRADDANFAPTRAEVAIGAGKSNSRQSQWAEKPAQERSLFKAAIVRLADQFRFGDRSQVP